MVSGWNKNRHVPEGIPNLFENKLNEKYMQHGSPRCFFFFVITAITPQKEYCTRSVCAVVHSKIGFDVFKYNPWI